MPANIIFRKTADVLLEGPIVQIIFVFTIWKLEYRNDLYKNPDEKILRASSGYTL
jgi:hypothetical protein